MDPVHPFKGRELLSMVDVALSSVYREGVALDARTMSLAERTLVLTIQRRKVLARLVGEILFDLAGDDTGTM
jgi:hypothetical protein